MSGANGPDGQSLGTGQVIKSRYQAKRLYTLAEAAAYLGRSTWSVRRLIWDGALPSVRAGGRVHVDVRDMDEFIDRNKFCEELGQAS
ncbi:MAG: helix-turn-helix domain-containing protein [Nitrospiraceae bacterium]